MRRVSLELEKIGKLLISLKRLSDVELLEELVKIIPEKIDDFEDMNPVKELKIEVNLRQGEYLDEYELEIEPDREWVRLDLLEFEREFGIEVEYKLIKILRKLESKLRGKKLVFYTKKERYQLVGKIEKLNYRRGELLFFVKGIEASDEESLIEEIKE